MSTISPAELARRVTASSKTRLDKDTARRFLEHWRDTGIACEIVPGRWRLTASGAAMFSAWTADDLDLEDADS